jgi:ribosomal protein S27AE
MYLPVRPEHTESLVCPRCGKSTIVLHGDSTYVCLDRQCGFRHDVSNSTGNATFGGFLASVVGFILLVAFI